MAIHPRSDSPQPSGPPQSPDPMPPDTSSPNPTPRSDGPGGPRHRRWPVGAALLTLAVLGLAFVLAWLRFGGKPTSTERTAQSTSPELPKPTGKERESISMRFVRVPKGKFWMGGGGKPGEKQVEITNDFNLGIYEVTQGRWEEVMGAGKNPSYFSRTGYGKERVKGISDADLKQFPVENVAWNDVNEFINKLNEREKEHNAGWRYRLPKEREWEYACRGGATSPEDCSFDFYLDKPTNDLSSAQANFSGLFPAGNAPKADDCLYRPQKVGSYAANQLGLFDMHGNVWEWCDDLYSEGGSDRVFRGGSYLNSGQFCRAAYRNHNPPTYSSYNLGFRLARVPSVP